MHSSFASFAHCTLRSRTKENLFDDKSLNIFCYHSNDDPFFKTHFLMEPPPPLKLNLWKPEPVESPIDELITFAPNIAACTKRGPVRQSNEDRVAFLSIQGETCLRLCAVMDGHGGAEFSDYLKQNLAALGTKLKQVDLEGSKTIITEELIRLEQSAKHLEGGTCFLLMVESATQLLFANTGDCCAIILNKDGSMTLPVQKHAPEQEGELKRINSANLRVSSGRVWNESGEVGLNVSRSMGDFQLKGKPEDPHLQAVTVVPEFICVDKDKVHKCLLISDGVLESLRDIEVLALMSLGDTAEDIVNKAIQENSTDNCSALLMTL